MSFQNLSLGSFILSFAVVTSILTISVIIILVLICLLKRRLFLEEDRLRERPAGPGLSRSVIAALPTFSYKPENNTDHEEIECPVCLGLIQKNAVIKVLPNCSHMFDEECIGKWLESHKTCPVCRTMAEPVATNQESRIEIGS